MSRPAGRRATTRRCAAVLAIALAAAACSAEAPQARRSSPRDPAGAIAETKHPKPPATPDSAAREPAPREPGAFPTAIREPDATAVSGPPATPPRAGLYRYAQTGGFAFGAGGLSLSVPKEGTLRVAPATGADVLRQRQSRRISREYSEEQTLLWEPGRVALARIVARYGTGAQANEMRCRFDTPLTLVRLPLEPGTSWTDTARCAGLRWSLRASMLREEQVTVGGTRVETVVMRATLVVRGDGLTQTGRATYWISPAHRLVVRSSRRTSGDYQGVATESNLRERLVSLQPRP